MINQHKDLWTSCTNTFCVLPKKGHEFWERRWWLESSTTYIYFGGVKSRGVLDSLCLLFGCLTQQIFWETWRSGVWYILLNVFYVIWIMLVALLAPALSWQGRQEDFFFCFTLPPPSSCQFIMRQGKCIALKSMVQILSVLSSCTELWCLRRCV